MEDSCLRTRGYQLEMFERSMLENIIVAMDTGSGKTHIALLRIQAELDRSSGPQHKYLSSGLPATKCRLLVGSDNVDRWSEQKIWDAALDHVRLVISTHKILEDALAHGFVRLENICLLVFDEAHHCVRKHPANQIMQRFYHPRKEELGLDSVPHVLGLTASPIHAKLKQLKTIESNLDSIVVTPQKHRDELMLHVHRPDLVRLVYNTDTQSRCGPALRRLRMICAESVGSPPHHSSPQRRLASSPRKELTGTPWKDQLLLFQSKATYVCHTLGPWSADYFVLESIRTLTRLSEENHEIFFLWARDERSCLTTLLGQDEILSRLGKEHHVQEITVSDKVGALLSFLETKDLSKSKTLVFVERRVTAGILSALLCKHPNYRGRYHSAPFVGLSNISGRKYRMPELLDLAAQSQSLVDFRTDGKNIIVATNALEEGIDVQTCNLVICFDLPQNVRSFIQRRGRARAQQSVFALLFEEQESHERLREWQDLEEQLQTAYRDTLREKSRRTGQFVEDEFVDFVLESKVTGASLTANEAMAHLHHFCQNLPPQPYTDLRPVFSFNAVKRQPESIRAVVTLPNCVDASVRRVESDREWETERAAAIDAAFHCYKALYEAGLLNENLLPISHGIELDLPQYNSLGATIEVVPELNCWAPVVQGWADPWFHPVATEIRFSDAGEEHPITMLVNLPCEPPRALQRLRAYWTPTTNVDITFKPKSKQRLDQPKTLHIMRRTTHLISRSTHSDYSTENGDDFLVLFLPYISVSNLSAWLERNTGRISASGSLSRGTSRLKIGFLRHSLSGGHPELFRGCFTNEDGNNQFKEIIQSNSLTKRRNFTVPVDRGQQTSNDTAPGHEDFRYNEYPAAECTIDRLPAEIARLNLLLPVVLQHFQDSWTVERLTTTILQGIPCSHPRLILAAITPPALQRELNYEALEFLGDSIIKLVVSLQLFEQHQNWPEGFLTRKRALLVSNEHLAHAALEVGLPPFIRTKPNSWKKWWPIYISDLGVGPTPPRPIRTKVLADVVEALVGAVYMSAGLEGARQCIQKLVPSMGLGLPNFETRPVNDWTERDVKDIEAVIGYNFRSQLLLVEALTHPSFEGDHMVQSYQRLEFLGDAVLDAIIASRLMQHKRKRSPGDMTRIKAAIANGHLLGFFCLDFDHLLHSQGIQETSRHIFKVTEQSRRVRLWQLIRCSDEIIRERCEEADERLLERGPAIRQQIETSLVYPWAQLTMLNPDKFFSDVVESLLGAIYIDSRGSLVQCTAFLERIGIMAYFDRLMEENVDVVHPRTKLDWKTGSKTIDYKVTRSRETGKYLCSVILADEPFVHVDGHETSEQVIVTAAQTALLKLSDTSP